MENNGLNEPKWQLYQKKCKVCLIHYLTFTVGEILVCYLCGFCSS